MSPEETVARLKLLTEAIPVDLMDEESRRRFWDKAMLDWFNVYRGELSKVAGEVAMTVVRLDGAMSLLLLYVMTARIENSTRACAASRDIQAALRRLAYDLADALPLPSAS